MLTAGALRACWPLGLAFIRPGAAGIALVIAVQLGLVTCVGVFNPVFASYRLDQTETDRVARTLSAWSVTSNASIAALTALWGSAGQHHQPPNRDRDRRYPPAATRSCSPDTAAHRGASGSRPRASHDTSHTDPLGLVPAIPAEHFCNCLQQFAWEYWLQQHGVARLIGPELIEDEFVTRDDQRWGALLSGDVR
jgi:hypothetical protein